MHKLFDGCSVVVAEWLSQAKPQKSTSLDKLRAKKLIYDNLLSFNCNLSHCELKHSKARKTMVSSIDRRCERVRMVRERERVRRERERESVVVVSKSQQSD